MSTVGSWNKDHPAEKPAFFGLFYLLTGHQNNIKQLNQKQVCILHLIFHHLTVVHSLKKEFTLKICVSCFDTIKSILLDLLGFWVLFYFRPLFLFLKPFRLLFHILIILSAKTIPLSHFVWFFWVVLTSIPMYKSGKQTGTINSVSIWKSVSPGMKNHHMCNNNHTLYEYQMTTEIHTFCEWRGLSTALQRMEVKFGLPRKWLLSVVKYWICGGKRNYTL